MILYADIKERLHLWTVLSFILLWEANTRFLQNALLVICVEVGVDFFKHAFLSKLNSVIPATYTDFIKNLCFQITDNRTDQKYDAFGFVPLAPAAMVIRAVVPLVAAFWAQNIRGRFSVVAAFLVVAISKVAIGYFLPFFARWFIRLHPD